MTIALLQYKFSSVLAMDQTRNNHAIRVKIIIGFSWRSYYKTL